MYIYIYFFFFFGSVQGVHLNPLGSKWSRPCFWGRAFKEDVSLFQFCDLNSSLVSWEMWSANMVCSAEPRRDWRGLWSSQFFFEFTETLWAWLYIVSALCLGKFFFFGVTCFLKPFVLYRLLSSKMF